ncbi:8422_t:CDS:2 [Funneliformis geosporum]|uniref:8422_t:CDS:1 n=1 Tax=Funneliformis geosporum TaxID=1117311 RepID=A0A9W4SJW1_9GLOM|nr:8422_t:CDS:2 [Funneliformis geosporum]
MLYVADAAKLDLYSDEQTSAKRFCNAFAEAIWKILKQKYRKTLVAIDKHGVVKFVGPLSEDIFDDLLKLYPFWEMKKLHQK